MKIIRYIKRYTTRLSSRYKLMATLQNLSQYNAPLDKAVR